jgi:glutamate synthase domain-containing protein 3
MDSHVAAAIVSVSELRDYERINAEVVRLLESGSSRILLTSVEGQRLLLLRITGPWRALIEVEGTAGPEFAAELHAPNLTVICRGGAADGAARELRGGKILICGDVTDAAGYRLQGGDLVIGGAAGHRAGLQMAGGTLLLLADAGRLAGERQTGGTIFVHGQVGPYAGHGQSGGRLIQLDRLRPASLGGEVRAQLDQTLGWVRPWYAGQVADL